jgi:hypothetical protein
MEYKPGAALAMFKLNIKNTSMPITTIPVNITIVIPGILKVFFNDASTYPGELFAG